MKRLAMVSMLFVLLGPARISTGLPADGMHEVRLNGRTFALRDGFEMELVAGPPLVDRPIVADFDDLGRLYVADSSGSNDKVEKQLAEKPHRIVRLEDTDGDGRFDQRTVFADKMMFPEGVMWLDGSLYVAAPPSICKLTDTDGDGVADRRVEWFQGKTLTGCANDLHGPYRGRDGWIYWCKGAFAKQTYERPGRSPFVTRAAHIFRCRPDGSGIEPVMTGGMDNPVDVVFTLGGERIFTTTFLQQPGGGRRDGLIHAIYGGVYGKVHDVIEDHKRTSPDMMPVLAHLGPAAPCGLTLYESSACGPEYQGNLFATLFNMRKVTRHILEPAGASFTSRDEDFLTSSDQDFHPTDIHEDADGSLLVIDTGGWYKLCCPSSQLHKPDVLGAIYRVRKSGTRPQDDPRGSKIDWPRLSAAELAGGLSDPRPAVRSHAVNDLAKRGGDAIPVLASVLRLPLLRSGASQSLARVNAVWALTRIDDPRARAIVRGSLADPDETVRHAAIHSVSLNRDRDAASALRQLLQSGSAPNQRAAAEALGRIGDAAAVSDLLTAVGRVTDRALDHSLTFALIEIADRAATSKGLESDNTSTRRAALVALDQMDGGGLSPAIVAPLLSSRETVLKSTAAWIVGRHPEWASALAGSLRERLAAHMTPDERSALEGQLARFARATEIQGLIADRVSDDSAALAVRESALRAMSQAGLKEPPGAWIAALARVIKGPNAALARQAIATVRALNVPREKAAELIPAFRSIIANSQNGADLRLEALAALPGGPGEVATPLFEFLRSQLKPDLPVATRINAADVLSRSKLTADQLGSLAESVKTAGALEAERLVASFEQSGDEAVGLKLVSALRQSPALTSLRVDMLKTRLAKYGAPVQQQAQELYATLNVNAKQQQQRLEELLPTLTGGDIRRGQAVFNNPKAACSACHAIGYLGGNIGPDLTRIGQIRTERDLLESIIYPSASFVRSYEPVVVATKDGRIVSGAIRKDSAAEVVLAISATEEVRIARDEIEEIRPGTVSVMPSGLDQQLSSRDFADLLAFLKACR